MYKCCYELDIKIPNGLREHAVEIWEKLEEKFGKDESKTRHTTRQEHPELFEWLGPENEWLVDTVRILNNIPEVTGTGFMHFANNNHGYYPGKGEWVKADAGLNVPLFDLDGIETHWFDQQNPDDLGPYDFYIDRELIKKTKFNIVDRFEIKTKPVLFRLGKWHQGIAPGYTKRRTMLSFTCKYSCDWDNWVNVWKRTDKLIER
jgi:hypothetical protein